MDSNRKVTDPAIKEVNLIECRKNSNRGFESEKRNDDTMLVPNTKREDLLSEPNIMQDDVINLPFNHFINDDRPVHQGGIESECPLNNKIVFEDNNNTNPNHHIRKASNLDPQSSGKKSMSIPYCSNLLQQDKHSSSSKIQSKPDNILEARVILFRNIVEEDNKKDRIFEIASHQQEAIPINHSLSNDIVFSHIEGNQSEKICLVHEIV